MADRISGAKLETIYLTVWRAIAAKHHEVQDHEAGLLAFHPNATHIKVASQLKVDG